MNFVQLNALINS